MKELVLPFLLAVVPTEHDNEIECLREAIYFEARGESITGQAMVADVIANRVNDSSEYWEDTYCEVVYSPKQFSYTHTFNDLTQYDVLASFTARRIAEAIFYNHPNFRGISDGALMYHTTSVSPKWDYTKLTPIVTEGNHIFYDYQYTGRK